MTNLLAVLVAVLATLSLVSCEGKVSLERAGVAYTDRPFRSMLNVSNGERFGSWTWPEMCPDEFFAVGFSLRVEKNQFGLDDTALNGIRLICAKDEDRNFLFSVESHTGYFGEWSRVQFCPTGTLTSFQLRVDKHRGVFVDDTAANNIRFRCSGNIKLDGPGMHWGEFGPWSQECNYGGICGIETKMEDNRVVDDTSLNDVRFHCCDSQ